MRELLAKAKLRAVDIKGNEHWAVYQPCGHRLDCFNEAAAKELAAQINNEITQGLKIGGYDA
jgi:hypothetical protein